MPAFDEPETPAPAAVASRGMVAFDDPRAGVWNLIRGPWRFAAIHALAVLGCPAHLAAGPLPVAELAIRCGAQPDALERLLRCAASAGLLAQTGPGCYAFTSAGRTLVPGSPGSMHAAILATGESAGWHALIGLAAVARRGEPAFSAREGSDFYDYLAAHPAVAEIFQDFMASRSADIAAGIAGLDLSGSTVIADIGGGRGTILAALLSCWPHLTGVLVDRQHVLDSARLSLINAGLTGRVQLAAGDYLTGPVPEADTYLLASILHNHDDEQAGRILDNIMATAVGRPRVLLADLLLPDYPAPHIGCDLDVRMMALGTGRERTRTAYLALLHNAGLTEISVIGAPYGLNIIDARPGNDGSCG